MPLLAVAARPGYAGQNCPARCVDRRRTRSRVEDRLREARLRRESGPQLDRRAGAIVRRRNAALCGWDASSSLWRWIVRKRLLA